MNLLQIIAMALRLWRENLAWYVFSGLVLGVCSLISLGLLSGTLIADMGIALVFGPTGTWITQPVLVIVILLTTFFGTLASTYLMSASVGAFLHTCAQIGAGKREINLLGFLEYALHEGPHFWLIALLVLSLCALFSVPIAIAGLLFTSYSPFILPLALVVALSLALLITLPFWLAYPAHVVHRRGILPSLIFSLRASARSPLSSLVLLLLLLFLLFAPMVSLIFYPVYFFFLFAPLAAVLMLVYYESVQGLIKN